jgi:hypothetical protein
MGNANTALPTLLEEMVHLNVLPHCINLIDLLTIELPAYQIRAQAECVKLVAEQINLWKF